MDKLDSPIIPDVDSSDSSTDALRRQMLMSLTQVPKSKSSSQIKESTNQEANESVELDETKLQEDKGLHEMSAFSGKRSVSLLEETMQLRNEKHTNTSEQISDEEREKILENIKPNLSLIGDLIQ
jgi:hypothetical protein